MQSIDDGNLLWTNEIIKRWSHVELPHTALTESMSGEQSEIGIRGGWPDISTRIQLSRVHARCTYYAIKACFSAWLQQKIAGAWNPILTLNSPQKFPPHYKNTHMH